MNGGVRIGSVRGILIRVHPTLLLVLPFLALSSGPSLTAAAALAGVPAHRLGGSALAWGLLVAVALFASVVPHPPEPPARPGGPLVGPVARGESPG